MATSLISESQKNTIKAIIDDIHETFARTITVYEEGEKTTEKTVVSHLVKARIKYIKADESNITDGKIGSQLGIEIINGLVRITVNKDGFEILKEAKRCEFEGRKYTISSKGNPTGIFGPQYYHFYLSPIEE